MSSYEGMGSAHISAMDNEQALNSLVWINDPFALPWHMVAMEGVYLLCMLLICLHAGRSYQKGDRAAPFTFIALVVYGVTVEAVSAVYVNNFCHR